MTTTQIVTERHFTVKELSEMWHFDRGTVRAMFDGEPGVLRIGTSHRPNKRGYVSIRIPESVARRVHERCSR